MARAALRKNIPGQDAVKNQGTTWLGEIPQPIEISIWQISRHQVEQTLRWEAADHVFSFKTAGLSFDALRLNDPAGCTSFKAGHAFLKHQDPTIPFHCRDQLIAQDLHRAMQMP